MAGSVGAGGNRPLKKPLTHVRVHTRRRRESIVAGRLSFLRARGAAPVRPRCIGGLMVHRLASTTASPPGSWVPFYGGAVEKPIFTNYLHRPFPWLLPRHCCCRCKCSNTSRSPLQSSAAVIRPVPRRLSASSADSLVPPSHPPLQLTAADLLHTSNLPWQAGTAARSRPQTCLPAAPGRGCVRSRRLFCLCETTNTSQDSAL